MDTSHPIICAPITEFCRIAGLGRSKVYEMLAAGEIDSITVGRRRLILLDSFQRLIQRQRAAGAQTAAAAPDVAVRKGRGRAPA